MKRAATALLVGLVIFGGIYGLASSLGLSTKTLGSGNSVVAACLAATLSTAYTTSYDSSIPGYKVTIVTVSNLQSSCYSMSYSISLTNASNTSLGVVGGTTPGSGSSFTADFTSQNVNAATVANVVVTISG